VWYKLGSVGDGGGARGVSWSYIVVERSKGAACATDQPPLCNLKVRVVLAFNGVALSRRRDTSFPC